MGDDLAVESLDLRELGRKFFAKEEPINQVAESLKRDDLVDYVRERAERIALLVETLTPEQLGYRRGGKPAAWDASGDEAEFDTSEIVTHLAMGTTFYWYVLARALGHPRPSFPRAPQGASVTGTAGSPLGRGGWSGQSAEELVSLLRSTADGFLSYVEGLSPESEEVASTYESYGTLTLKGWLLLLAVHFEMHLQQLEEMQAQPDYPRN